MAFRVSVWPEVHQTMRANEASWSSSNSLLECLGAQAVTLRLRNRCESVRCCTSTTFTSRPPMMTRPLSSAHDCAEVERRQGTNRGGRRIPEHGRGKVLLIRSEFGMAIRDIRGQCSSGEASASQDVTLPNVPRVDEEAVTTTRPHASYGLKAFAKRLRHPRSPQTCMEM